MNILIRRVCKVVGLWCRIDVVIVVIKLFKLIVDGGSGLCVLLCDVDPITTVQQVIHLFVHLELTLLGGSLPSSSCLTGPPRGSSFAHDGVVFYFVI